MMSGNYKYPAPIAGVCDGICLECKYDDCIISEYRLNKIMEVLTAYENPTKPKEIG